MIFLDRYFEFPPKVRFVGMLSTVAIVSVQPLTLDSQCERHVNPLRRSACEAPIYYKTSRSF